MKKNQAEALKEFSFKFSFGHFIQGLAYLTLLIVIILYFNSTLAPKNIYISNSQDSIENSSDVLNLIKYGSIISLFFLVIITFYLSFVEIKIIDENNNI